MYRRGTAVVLIGSHEPQENPDLSPLVDRASCQDHFGQGSVMDVLGRKFITAHSRATTGSLDLSV
jgi:hypothetical protein